MTRAGQSEDLNPRGYLCLCLPRPASGLCPLPGPPIIVGEPTSLRPKSGPKCPQKIGHFDGQMSEKNLGSAALGGRLSAYSMWVQNGKKMSVPCEVGCVYNKICMERVGWTVWNSGKCTLHRTSCRTPSMTTETFGLRYISLWALNI